MAILTNDVRSAHRDEILEGLALVDAFVRKQLSIAQFVERFGSHFDTCALDGHEDKAGPIPHDQLRATLSLRLLHDVTMIVGATFEQTDNAEAYLAAGRIPIAELHERVLVAIAHAALDLAATTLTVD